MNHPPSDDSANVPPSSQAVVVGAADLQEDREFDRLNPALQQALGCLDIKLEDELTRFRATQKERSPQPQLAPVSETIWEQQSIGLDASGDILTAEILQPARVHPIEAQDDRHSLFSEEAATPSGGFIIIDGLVTATTNSRNAITTVNYASIASQRNEVPTLRESLDLNFSSGGEIAPFREEYSSSSQELLRQIQSGYPSSATDPAQNRPQTAPTAIKGKSLTPLKLGSIAAACALAGGVAYTALNPSILAPLVATKTIAPTATTNSLGQLIQSPNLAANEFTELNLSTINNLKLPTVAAPAPATNVSMATTPTATAPISTAPAAIPFKAATSTPSVPTATITSQPRLADSLVKSLLPPNFHAYKPAGSRTMSPGSGR
jgi:hypothetical protein